MTRACALVQDLLLDTAARVPAKIAITCGADAITYAALARRAASLAGTLARAGVRRGDRVAIAGENGIAPAIAFWGVLLANAAPVVLHPQTRPARLAKVLADCEARALVADHRIAAELTARPPVVLELAGPAWLAALEAGAPPPRACIDADLALIAYTSGSTGEPKGAAFTHRAGRAAHASIAEYLGITGDDVILSTLPLAFGYGLYQMIMAIAAGGRIVLERSFAFPAEVLHRIEAERATGFPGVPTMFATLLRIAADGAFDLSSLRYVTNAAAALAPAQAQALCALLPHAQIFSMYGQTECVRATYLPPERLAAKPASIGIAIPNTELWLEDEHGRRLGPGEVGELVIRSASLMAGYWNRPDATEAKLRRSTQPGPVPGERVLHTGDLCRLDEDGDLYFVARTDEVIKSGGEKIAPKLIEDVLLAMPGVCEAAVVGVPDDRLGQAVRAFVVLEPGAALDPPAIQRACREHLEPYLVPHEIVVRDELPRNANGKVHKASLT